MRGNIFGKLLQLSTFGESHRKFIGGVLTGFPSGIIIDFELIEKDMERRRPGQTVTSSERSEPDKIEIVSGINNGKSTGAPIMFYIHNKDARPEDYKELENIFRPSHADYTYYKKYGEFAPSGGGRSSGRETANWVAAGALAKCFLNRFGIIINAYTSGIGDIELDKSHEEIDFAISESNFISCPDMEIAKKMEKLILDVKEKGDSIGGRINCVIQGLMPGVGEPVFDKLQACLGKAMLSIPAVKGFEYGSGFAGSHMLGSDHNDEFYSDEQGNISTHTNNSGGIQGGISNGCNVYFRVAFKPVSSILKTQRSVDVSGKPTEFKIQGRHDSCVVPRAVPVVEAMAALVVADLLLVSGISEKFDSIR